MSEEKEFSADEALKAFQEFKSTTEETFKKVDDISEASADTQGKVDKLSGEIVGAVEAQQKNEQRLKALEETDKKLTEALARKGLSGNKAEDAKAEMKEFINEFAREGGQVEVSDFAKKFEFKTLRENTDPDGGYLVMPEFGGIIEGRIFETSPLRLLANVTGIGTQSLELIIDDDEAASGGWVAEEGTISDTATPQIRKKTITAFKQYAQPKATEEMLADGVVDMEAWLSGKVADILGRTENTAFINGDGSGKPRGLTTYDAWATAGTYEYGKIEQVNSGSNGAVAVDGLIDLVGSLKDAYQTNAAFMMQRNTFYDITKLKSANNYHFLSLQPGDKQGTIEVGLMGKRVVFADDMAATGTTGNLAIAYGDFGRGYQIVDRQGVQILRDPYTAKGFVKFYTTKRTGGDVVNFDALKLQKLSS